MTDQAVRARCLNPEKSFIVQAPAGSGKTELLVQRYLSLLGQNVTAPEEITAITFTKKAASEMRERVIQSLKLGLGPKPQAPYLHVTWQLAKQALKQDAVNHWEILKNPARMRITTIDSLCASLTSSMPVTSKFGNLPDVSSDASSLYVLAIRALFEDLNSDEPWKNSLEVLALHLENRLDLFESLLVDMLSKREQWLETLMTFKGQSNAREHLERAIESLYEDVEQKASQCLPVFFKDILSCALSAMDNLGLALHHPQDDDLTFSALIKDLHAVAKIFLTKTGGLRKTLDKRSGFPTDQKALKQRAKDLLDHLHTSPEFVSILSEVLLLPDQSYHEGDWLIVESLLEILPVLVAHLQVVFMEKGQVDFNEIAIRALHSLGDEESPTDLALTLDYHIRHLLVDEFQDTSQLQYRLIESLVREWSDSDSKTLFLVGDPMQSIYRFRQADVSLFLQTKESGIGNVLLDYVQLVSNFRSSRGVVDWVNREFSHVFPVTENRLSGGIPYCASVANQDFPGGVVCYAFGENTSEAHYIISQIQLIVSEQNNETVAVLGRSRSHLVEIMQGLSHYGIPFQAVDMESLSCCMVVQDLTTLLYTIVYPEDSLSWFSLLRSPVIGLELSDLLLMKGFEWLSNESLPFALSDFAHARLNAVIPILQKANMIKIEKPTAIWLKEIWIDLGGPSTVSKNEVAQAEQFFNLLEQIQSWGIPDREQLSAEINRLFAKSQSSPSRVSIMTIHKSKGLEFDHVFLPGMNKGTRSESQPLLLWDERLNKNQWQLLLAPIKKPMGDHSSHYSFLYQYEQKKSALESARLFYVAATRAKSMLYLTAVFEAERPKPRRGSFAGMVELNWQEPQSSAIFKGLNKSSPLRRHRRLNSDYTYPFKPFIIEPEPNLNIPEFPILNHMEKSVGTLIHQYLEYSQYRVEPELIVTQLKGLGVSQRECDQAQRMVVKALETISTSEKGRWILKKREVTFSEYPIFERRGSRLLKRVIDRAFVEDGILWIIDYKTSDEFATNESYREQLQKYQQLMSQQYPQYYVKTALYNPLQDELIEVSGLMPNTGLFNLA